MTVSGIDVASYQGTDYNTAGLSFVMVKATEGTGYVNPHRAGQVATGRVHGLVVGHYHFARPGDMAAQAAFFLRTAAPKPGDVLCLDWEDAGVSSDWKDAWIRHVQAAAPEHRVVLYCNRDFWINRDHTSFAGDGLWIADPGVAAGHPRVTHPWTFHQYSEAGGLDHNVANFPSTAAMRAWATGATTATTPTQEVDVQLKDKATAKAGAWTDHDQTYTVEQWLTLGNLKAGAAVAAVTALTAQVGALAKLVTEMAATLAKGGGLTAEQAEAASKAGADAALAELGDALTKGA